VLILVLWGKAKKVGCRCHCQQRLPLQLWKASGMHWWQEPWLLTDILSTTQGECKPYDPPTKAVNPVWSNCISFSCPPVVSTFVKI